MRFGTKYIPKKVKDIKPIYNGTNQGISKKEDLIDIVEEPCLKACEKLFEMNIETIDSGCNGENSPNRAYIIINYDALDLANKLIAGKMVYQGLATFFKKDEKCIRSLQNRLEIQIKTSPDDKVSDVETKLCNLVQQFKPQQKIKNRININKLISIKNIR